MTKKIGIFPGTFDPIHGGHIAFANEALKQCRLDEVVFLPEYSPRNKTDVTPLRHRVRMLELATEDQPKVSVVGLESKQFTVEETLPQIRALFPRDSIALLVGSDVVSSLPNWKGIGAMLKDCNLIIGLRQGDDDREIAQLVEALADVKYKVIGTDKHHLRSSSVRSQGGQELNVQIAAYIKANNLYNQSKI